MPDTDLIPAGTREALRNCARDLHHRFEGVFGEETIQAVLQDSSETRSAAASTSRGSDRRL